jgi:hypothetical protein
MENNLLRVLSSENDPYNFLRGSRSRVLQAHGALVRTHHSLGSAVSLIDADVRLLCAKLRSLALVIHPTRLPSLENTRHRLLVTDIIAESSHLGRDQVLSPTRDQGRFGLWTLGLQQKRRLVEGLPRVTHAINNEPTGRSFGNCMRSVRIWQIAKWRSARGFNISLQRMRA